jgi:glutamate N-acetyltransferase/amino-acid N-acetyltransferase
MQANGLSDVPGFSVAGVHCDVRGKGDGRLDLALIHSHMPCTAAAVFTRNAVCAAPVRLCRTTLAGAAGPIHAIVANSGNANACTGRAGLRAARSMQEHAARALGVPAGSVLVASTGRIGEPLPVDRVKRGIAAAAHALAATPEAGLAAADAILTSDTGRKLVTLRVPTATGTVTLSGMAKGAGMIQPGMATMLAFLATDARIPRRALQQALGAAVDSTFNAITVDGDMSTNDTVLLLANGASGIRLGPRQPDAWRAFRAALAQACATLAEKIVGDGEKITKVVAVEVRGARSRADAEAVARAIGNSLLVKSSWYGNDPNWGRILDAAGYAGAALVEDRLQLHYQAPHGRPVPAFVRGEARPRLKPRWREVVAQPRFSILLDLGLGRACFRLLATDLSEGYVHFNKSE